MLSLAEFLRNENLHGINTTCIFPNTIATRDDIIKLINTKYVFDDKIQKYYKMLYFSFRIKLLTPQDAAKTVVSAIINRSEYETIPKVYDVLIPIFNVMPFWMQRLFRHYIFDEENFLNKA